MNIKRYVLYVDESGISDLTDKMYSNFLLTGLALDHEEDLEMSGYFNFLKRRYHLDQSRSFHAYHLFEDRSCDVYLSDAKAKRISESLAEFINISPIRVCVHSLEKSRLKSFLNIQSDDDFKGSEKQRRDKELPYELLSGHIFHWFADLTKYKNARGEIVAESRKSSDYTLLSTYLRCKNPDAFTTNLIKKSCQKMNTVISSIRFESKIGIRPGLEVADLISYVSYLHLNRRLQKFRKRGLVRVWHAIEKRLEKKKIQVVTNSGFVKYTRADRVRKKSNMI